MKLTSDLAIYALRTLGFSLSMLEQAVGPIGFTAVALGAGLALANAPLAFLERHVIAPAL